MEQVTYHLLMMKGEDKPRKYYVGDVTVRVLSERVQYVDKDGKLITESLLTTPEEYSSTVFKA